MMVIGGNKERLIGKLQERYGIAKGEAEQQLRQWQDKERA
jgi:uncharacterized protein YjbJ (UPF0337 family)